MSQTDNWVLLDTADGPRAAYALFACPGELPKDTIETVKQIYEPRDSEGAYSPVMSRILTECLLLGAALFVRSIRYGVAQLTRATDQYLDASCGWSPAAARTPNSAPGGEDSAPMLSVLAFAHGNHASVGHFADYVLELDGGVVDMKSRVKTFFHIP